VSAPDTGSSHQSVDNRSVSIVSLGQHAERRSIGVKLDAFRALFVAHVAASHLRPVRYIAGTHNNNGTFMRQRRSVRDMVVVMNMGFRWKNRTELVIRKSSRFEQSRFFIQQFGKSKAVQQNTSKIILT
jgi:hypothetical protein